MIPAGLSPTARKLAFFDAVYFEIESFFNLLSGVAIFFVMGLGVTQIFGRALFNSSIVGYVDIIEISISIFAFLGISYVQKLSGHVRMEIIIGRFRGRLLWATEIFGTLVALFVVFVLIIYSWDHFMRSWTIGDSTMDIELPLWPSKIIIPFTLSMLEFRLLLQLLGFIRIFIYPRDPHQIGIPIIETVDEAAQHEIDAGLVD